MFESVQNKLASLFIPLLFLKVNSLKNKTFLEFFKVVSLFSYQGSCLSYLVDSLIMLTRLLLFVNNFFQVFSNLFRRIFRSSLKLHCRSRQLLYNIIWFFICQQVFSYFSNFFYFPKIGVYILDLHTL